MNQTLSAELEKLNMYGISSIPAGNYTVTIENMFTCTHGETPVMIVKLRILDGEYMNQHIILEEPLSKTINIYNVNKFLRMLDTNVLIAYTTNRELDCVLRAIIDQTKHTVYTFEYKPEMKRMSYISAIYLSLQKLIPVNINHKRMVFNNGR